MHPNEVRGPIETEYGGLRDAREKQYIADKQALEDAYRADLQEITTDRAAALTAAGFNPDGSVPDTFNRDAPVNTAAPVVTGNPNTGQTLTSTAGQWTGADSTTYQWLRDGVAIPGATNNTYVLQVADEGHAIRARVTGTNEIGQTIADSNIINAVA